MLERIEGKPDRYDENWVCSYDPDFEYHGIELDFWAKLDTDLYNWTLKWPIPIGTLFRLIFSVLGVLLFICFILFIEGCTACALVVPLLLLKLCTACALLVPLLPLVLCTTCSLVVSKLYM